MAIKSYQLCKEETRKGENMITNKALNDHKDSFFPQEWITVNNFV